MSYQPFYISNFEPDSGMDTYHEPFLIPEKAFAQLEDAYCWRGRVKKRDGFELLGRLRATLTNTALTNTDGTATYTNADIVNITRATQPNAELISNTVVITIDLGNPNVSVYNDIGGGNVVYVSGPYTISSGTINYITGALTLNFTVVPPAGLTVVATYSFYPSTPVMGLTVYETNTINAEELIAFDPRWAYKYTVGSFVRIGAPTRWFGTDSDFFWTYNYYSNANGKLFWATNFNAGGTPDPIRYWDNVSWTDFLPIVQADSVANPTRLQQARCIVAFKGRLLAFNTYEGPNLLGSTHFPQRLRWSQNGTPLEQGTVVAGPTYGVVSAWASDIVGYGGYLDAPTAEQIVSVEFIKDTLLVKFERSSWKLVYTGNEQLPFVFQKINTEMGSESTFSTIPFDRGVLTFGNWGITTDDSINVQRIDEKIPNYVLNINNDFDGVKRVHGIRDFARELVYWAYPSQKYNNRYPNKVLLYNYINNTFAVFNDSFTCFSQFQRTTDTTWSSLSTTTWAGYEVRWDSGKGQSFYPDIVAGNQQGNVLHLNQSAPYSSSLSITAITQHATNPVQITIPNHNLESDRFIKITSVLSTSGTPNPLTVLNGFVYKIIKVDGDIITLLKYNSTSKAFEPVIVDVGSTYLGLGRVQVFNNINIVTKRFSPFYDIGAQARLPYIDFLLEKTTLGEVTPVITIDENTSRSITDLYATTDPIGNPNSGLLGENVLLTRPENTTLIPYQVDQVNIWHRIYIQTICQNFQIQLTMNDLQMNNEDLTTAAFVLHAMVFYLSKNARLIQ